MLANYIKLALYISFFKADSKPKMLFWMIVGYLLGGSTSNAAKLVGDRVIFLHEEKLGHFDAQEKCESPTNATQLLKVDTKEIHKWIKEQNGNIQRK